jgi:hypothetical protein
VSDIARACGSATTYEPQPKQQEFHESAARYPLAEGGVSTDAAVVVLVDKNLCGWPGDSVHYVIQSDGLRFSPHGEINLGKWNR